MKKISYILSLLIVIGTCFSLISCKRNEIIPEPPVEEDYLTLEVNPQIIDDGIPFVCKSNRQGSWNSSWKLVPLDKEHAVYDRVVSYIANRVIPKGNIYIGQDLKYEGKLNYTDFVDKTGYNGHFRLDLTLSQDSDTLRASTTFRGVPSLSFVAYAADGSESMRIDNLSVLDGCPEIDWPISKISGMIGKNIFSFKTTPFFMQMCNMYSGRGRQFSSESYDFTIKQNEVPFLPEGVDFTGKYLFDPSNPREYIFDYHSMDVEDAFHLKLNVYDDMRLYAMGFSETKDPNIRVYLRRAIWDSPKNEWLDVMSDMEISASVRVRVKGRIEYNDDMTVYEKNPYEINTDRHNTVVKTFEKDSTFTLSTVLGRNVRYSNKQVDVFVDSGLHIFDFMLNLVPLASYMDIDLLPFLELVSVSSVTYTGEEEDIYTGLVRPTWKTETVFADYSLFDIELDFGENKLFKFCSNEESLNSIYNEDNYDEYCLFSNSLSYGRYRGITFSEPIKVRLSGSDDNYFHD